MRSLPKALGYMFFPRLGRGWPAQGGGGEGGGAGLGAGHAHAIYLGLSLLAPRFNPHIRRAEGRVQGLNLKAVELPNLAMADSWPINLQRLFIKMVGMAAVPRLSSSVLELSLR